MSERENKIQTVRNGPLATGLWLRHSWLAKPGASGQHAHMKTGAHVNYWLLVLRDPFTGLHPNASMSHTKQFKSNYLFLGQFLKMQSVMFSTKSERRHTSISYWLLNQ